MRIGALVPARMGSKRLPGKNVIELGGVPLVCRTLDVLLDSGVFADVTVSTESPVVAELVRSRYPAGEVSVLPRPEALAEDDAPLHRVAEHYAENRPDLAWIGLFMPTFPFRRTERLREAAAAIHSGYALRVQAVRPEQHWDQDYFYPVSGGFAPVFAGFPNLLRFSSTSYMLWRRETPQTHAMRLGYRLGEREYRLDVSLPETLDIDDAADLALAERILAGADYVQTPTSTTTLGPYFVQTPTGADVEAFVRWLGPDSLADPANPPLVLQKPMPPLFTARLVSDLPELHFLNPDARNHAWSPRYVQTANTAHCLPVYQHSPVWRIISREGPHHQPPGPVDRGRLGRPADAADHLVAQRRARFTADMAREPFYQGPYRLTRRSGDES